METPHLTIQGNGNPLIWMHGMLSSVESDRIYSLVDLNALANQVRLIRYDVCNKSVSGDYSWNAMTEELIGVVDSLENKQVLLGGVSMGSGTALCAAIRQPEKVKALILVTPPPAWEVRPAVQKLYEKIARRARPDHLPEFLKRLIQLNPDPPSFFEEQFPGTRQKLLELRQSFNPAYYYSIYHGGAISDFPEREQLVNLRVPTLIVADPDDANHPVEVAREMHSLIPKSELHLVTCFKDYTGLQKKVDEFIKRHQTNYES